MNPIAKDRSRWSTWLTRVTIAGSLPIAVVGCNDTQVPGLLSSIAPLTLAYVSDRLGGHDDDSDDSESWYCWPACSLFD